MAVIGMACIAMIIWAICYYLEKRGRQQMSFRAFKSLYEIAPKRWMVAEYGYIYTNPMYYSRPSFVGTDIYMSTFCGHLRYLHYACKERRRRIDKSVNKEREQLVSSWQADIDQYRENAEKEIQKLSEKIKQEDKAL